MPAGPLNVSVAPAVTGGVSRAIVQVGGGLIVTVLEQVTKRSPPPTVKVTVYEPAPVATTLTHWAFAGPEIVPPPVTVHE